MADKESWKLRKRPTGIPGLDHLTGGGLPARQATLAVGQAGAGKSILGLQILAHEVSQGRSGAFVSFEESPDQIRRNADSFEWGKALNSSEAWSIIDARLPPGLNAAGSFDLEGLLIALASRTAEMQDPWIVIDGIDQLLQHQPHPELAVDQIRELNDRCARHGWTLLLSGKSGNGHRTPRFLEGIEYMLPTILRLSAPVIDGRLQRSIRIAKYRGSGHVTDERSLIIDDNGLRIPIYETVSISGQEASAERISTGVPDLDDLLDGGLYRGSTLLVSGRPGTAKSTLAAGFAEASAKQGMRVLYWSFDEVESAFVRNLATVGIDLRSEIDGGRIRFRSRTSSSGLLAEHFLALQEELEAFQPECLVIDPISAFLKAEGSERSAFVLEQILSIMRRLGVTTIVTSLTAEDDPEGESSLCNVSTVADSWIVLDYNMRSGERNRSLSVVKARGSDHSNQQRELTISGRGLGLEEVYEYGSEVLMGTARAEKEWEERNALKRRVVERERQRQQLEDTLEETRAKAKRLKLELSMQEQLAAEDERLHRDRIEQIRRMRRAQATSLNQEFEE